MTMLAPLVEAQRIPDSLKGLTCPLAVLRPHPRNARLHADEVIQESLKYHGQYRPIVVANDGVILAGNGTYAAAMALGWTEIAVTIVDLPHTHDRARRILLMDNRANDLAGYDKGLLLRLLEGGIEGTGFDQQALDDLLGEVEDASRPSLGGDPDAVGDLPAEPISRTGDLLLLGKHRLLVGDATLGADVQRLLGEEKADLVWTDPPYGVDHVGGNTDPRAHDHRSGQGVRGDNLSAEVTTEVWEKALRLAWTHCKPGAPWYVTASPMPEQHFMAATVLRDLKVWRQTLIWDKGQWVFGRGDYHYQFEHIFYGWRADGGHPKVEDRTQGNIWLYARPTRSEVHPMMKPVELVVRALLNSSKPGGVVLDLFLGSGSTMIAAEQEGRRCYGMEIDPGYADVAVERWESLTGKIAERVRPSTSTSN